MSKIFDLADNIVSEKNLDFHYEDDMETVIYEALTKDKEVDIQSYFPVFESMEEAREVAEYLVTILPTTGKRNVVDIARIMYPTDEEAKLSKALLEVSLEKNADLEFVDEYKVLGLLVGYEHLGMTAWQKFEDNMNLYSNENFVLANPDWVDCIPEFRDEQEKEEFAKEFANNLYFVKYDMEDLDDYDYSTNDEKTQRLQEKVIAELDGIDIELCELVKEDLETYKSEEIERE